MNFSKFNTTPPHLKEAMKLMKSGRLKEATTLIQDSLSGTAANNHTGEHSMNEHTMKDVTPDSPKPDLSKLNSSVPNSSKTSSSKSNSSAPNSSAPNSTKPQDSTAHTDASASTDKLTSKLQAFTDKMKDFKLDLPSAIDLSALSGGATIHSEPAIPENAQFLKGTLTSTQGNHSYRLYIPSNYEQALEKGLRLPLIVMLHGCTQSPEDFATGTRMNELAEEHQCLIVYPSQPNSANQNRCWNWFQPSDQQPGQGEPAWLAALTKSIINDYAVDASRVYIAGLSAGAAMAIIMAEAYPDIYAAVGVHSGLAYRSATDLPSALMAMRQGSSATPSATKDKSFVPMIVFHGDQDHTVSIRNGQQIFEQAKERLQAQKSDLTTQQHKKGSEQHRRSTQLQVLDDKGSSQLEYWKIHGAGHSWAGGSSAGSYTDPQGPDASKEMLRFFLSH